MSYKFTNYGMGYNKKVFDLIHENSFVLDVGCSSGGLGKKLIEEKKCRVYGVDFSPKSIKNASKILHKAKLFDLDSVKVPFSKEKFDVIVFADVLEHIKNPECILERFSKILKKDGVIIASIPNIAYVSARINHLFGKWDYYETGLMDKTHIKFFTSKTINELFLKTGYSIKETYFTPGLGFSFFDKFNSLFEFRKFICGLYPRLLAVQFIIVARKVD
jgi:O-antigen biosynthesis protein